MDRAAWPAAVHGAAKSRTQLTNTFTFVRSRKFPSLPTLLKFYHGWAMNFIKCIYAPTDTDFFSLVIL